MQLLTSRPAQSRVWLYSNHNHIWNKFLMEGWIHNKPSILSMRTNLLLSTTSSLLPHRPIRLRLSRELISIFKQTWSIHRMPMEAWALQEERGLIIFQRLNRTTTWSVPQTQGWDKLVEPERPAEASWLPKIAAPPRATLAACKHPSHHP